MAHSRFAQSPSRYFSFSYLPCTWKVWKTKGPGWRQEKQSINEAFSLQPTYPSNASDEATMAGENSSTLWEGALSRHKRPPPLTSWGEKEVNVTERTGRITVGLNSMTCHVILCSINVTEMQLWLVMVCRWSWTQLLMMSELGSPTPESSSFLSSHWPDSRGRCSPVTTVYDIAEKLTFKNSVQKSTLPQTVSCAWLSSARDTCSINFSLLPSTDTLLVSEGGTGQLQSASHPKNLPALPAAILQEQIACKVLVSSKCDCNLV